MITVARFCSVYIVPECDQLVTRCCSVFIVPECDQLDRILFCSMSQNQSAWPGFVLLNIPECDQLDPVLFCSMSCYAISLTRWCSVFIVPECDQLDPVLFCSMSQNAISLTWIILSLLSRILVSLTGIVPFPLSGNMPKIDSLSGKANDTHISICSLADKQTFKNNCSNTSM